MRVECEAALSSFAVYTFQDWNHKTFDVLCSRPLVILCPRISCFSSQSWLFHWWNRFSMHQWRFGLWAHVSSSMLCKKGQLARCESEEFYLLGTLQSVWCRHYRFIDMSKLLETGVFQAKFRIPKAVWTRDSFLMGTPLVSWIEWTARSEAFNGLFRSPVWYEAVLLDMERLAGLDVKCDEMCRLKTWANTGQHLYVFFFTSSGMLTGIISSAALRNLFFLLKNIPTYSVHTSNLGMPRNEASNKN